MGRPAHLLRALLGLTLQAGAGAYAAEPDAQIIVTGTRLDADSAGLPGANTVLSHATIEARGDTTVTDLLRAVPGVQLTQPGAGGVTQLFMRGGEPNYTVFLLDGIKVNDPTNSRGGSFDLASLNLADIGRVEIVRGPQSSIYGSDALAGVVNMISRPGSDSFSATVEAEAGGDEYSRGGLALSGPLGSGDFALQLARRDDGEAVPGSTYTTDTAHARLRFAPDRQLSGGLVGHFSDTERSSFPEESGGPEYAELRTLDHASARDLGVGGDFGWQLSDGLELIGVASHYQRRDQYDSPGIAPGDQVPPNGARNDFERDNAGLRITASGAQRWSGTLGADFQHESGTSSGYVDFAPDLRVPNDFALDRDTVGVFAEGRVQASPRLLLQASLRHDEPDATAGETTGRVGALWSSSDATTRWSANWGTGFKLPSFFALASPLVGNPALRPEKSESVDIGVQQRLGDGVDVGLTLFSANYDDFIDFEPQTFSNVNRDRVSTRGVEVSGSWTLSPALSLQGHATWTDIDVEGSARQLLQRPDWRGGTMLAWTPRASWLVHLDWLYVGEVRDNSIPTGTVTLNDWQRVDLNVAWQASSRLRVALAVDNLLDAGYEEAVGFPAAGVRPRLTARYRFGN